MSNPSDSANALPFDVIDMPEPVPYDEGLALQQRLADQRRNSMIRDTLALLEHEPVYTIGRTRDQSSLGGGLPLPHPVWEISRGGQATYHGPGQLTGYPVFDLACCGRDLHSYLRLLEEALIRACAAFGVAAGREPGLTGVWANGGKMASIGVGVRRWISQHGFAINLTPECLHGFQAITPCGIADVRMTCLAAEAPSGTSVTRQAFTAALLPALADALAAVGVSQAGDHTGS